MTTSRVRASLLAGTLVASLFVGSTLLTACDSPRQTQVTPASQITDEPTSGMTPRERGQVRGQALKAARASIDAFLTDDANAMRSLFATEYPVYWAKVRKETAAEGRNRIREHELQSLEVTQLDEVGTQAIVEYYFIDKSYYTDKRGTPVTAPSAGKDAEEMIQLTLEKNDNKWVVIRMIGDEAVMK